MILFSDADGVLSPSRAHKERRTRVTNVGCGTRWTWRHHWTGSAKADGEIVWSWCPDDRNKFCETAMSPLTGPTRCAERRWLLNRHSGEREIRR